MGFWRTLWEGNTDEVTADFATLQDLIVASQLNSLAYNKNAALGVAAVFRARQLNADVPASLPVTANGVALTDTQQRVVEMILALQDHGDAYLNVTGRDFTVLRNDQVHVTWDENQTKRVYSTPTGDPFRTEGAVPNLAVISVNRGTDDLTGIGWLESSAVQGIIAIQKWSQTYFENNTEPTGLLLVPGVLDKAEAERLKAQIEGRAEGKRAPLYLTGGMTWQTTSFDAQASQWVQSHDAGVGDISSLSGVPPSFLAHAVQGSNLTYTNLSDIWALYYRQTLATTYITRIEEAWSKILGAEVLFDPEQLLVASLEQRVRSAAELVRTGFEPVPSVDVVGLPPLPHTGKIPVTVQPEVSNAQ